MRVLKDVKKGRLCGGLLSAVIGCMAYNATASAQDANAAYDTQDARLNAAYKTLSQSLDDAGRKALRAEERQWITGRDAACSVPAGTVVKNQCTTTQTSFRADELEKRTKGSTKAPSGGAASLKGDWAYRTDCNLGHDVEFSVTSTSPAIEGTWSDGTRSSGSQGRFKGESRDGKVYVRFCSEDGGVGDYPACPAYGDVGAYVVPEGAKLAWYRTVGAPSEAKFDKYVVLNRAPKGGKVPADTAACRDTH